MSDFPGQVETCSSCEFSRSMRISMGAPDAETSLCTIHHIERLTAQLAESARERAAAGSAYRNLFERYTESERKVAKLEAELTLADAMAAKVMALRSDQNSWPKEEEVYEAMVAYRHARAAGAEHEKPRGDQ